jgi:hypothetical protein
MSTIECLACYAGINEDSAEFLATEFKGATHFVQGTCPITDGRATLKLKRLIGAGGDTEPAETQQA